MKDFRRAVATICAILTMTAASTSFVTTASAADVNFVSSMVTSQVNKEEYKFDKNRSEVTDEDVIAVFGNPEDLFGKQGMSVTEQLMATGFKVLIKEIPFAGGEISTGIEMLEKYLEGDDNSKKIDEILADVKSIKYNLYDLDLFVRENAEFDKLNELCQDISQETDSNKVDIETTASNLSKLKKQNKQNTQAYYKQYYDISKRMDDSVNGNRYITSVRNLAAYILGTDVASIAKHQSGSDVFYKYYTFETKRHDFYRDAATSSKNYQNYIYSTYLDASSQVLKLLHARLCSLKYTGANDGRSKAGILSEIGKIEKDIVAVTKAYGLTIEKEEKERFTYHVASDRNSATVSYENFTARIYSGNFKPEEDSCDNSKYATDSGYASMIAYEDNFFRRVGGDLNKNRVIVGIIEKSYDPNCGLTVREFLKSKEIDVPNASMLISRCAYSFDTHVKVIKLDEKSKSDVNLKVRESTSHWYNPFSWGDDDKYFSYDIGYYC